ncbi:DUF192 domain-containing protein [Croceivirga sp. JEA036]|uniref:DUF192 domain-containing protein n=1 Tax=Croceivirga sp. JEA036 TaxID=2721162 RepID=UPI00143C1A8E|nr:DUF192 domain-containing protein [Croceivirga sp. JEA036]NJB37360.1 DUF192 domain-containing protein [Croceivirga sp. JEA036]
MKYSFALLFLALVSFTACKETESKTITTEKIAFTKEGELRIHKNDSLLVQLDIEFAETEYEVQTGLMYRDHMEEKQGMLFIFPDVSVHSFYMKNTEIPLDIIYIDENLNIASFQENAKPFDETGLSSLVPIQYVLEVNAGLAEKWNLEVGDKITYNR